jgi:hypothetical protein
MARVSPRLLSAHFFFTRALPLNCLGSTPRSAAVQRCWHPSFPPCTGRPAPMRHAPTGAPDTGPRPAAPLPLLLPLISEPPRSLAAPRRRVIGPRLHSPHSSLTHSRTHALSSVAVLHTQHSALLSSLLPPAPHLPLSLQNSSILRSLHPALTQENLSVIKATRA